MIIQNEAHKVCFKYACVKYIWHNPAKMNETEFSYYNKHWHKSLKYQIIFTFIINIPFN